MNDFIASLSNNDAIIDDAGLTASEIATSMVPVLIGMMVVAIIAVAMLL